MTDYQHLEFDELIRKTKLILETGISALQYRNKKASAVQKRAQATELKNLCMKYKACFIINDDIELTIEVDADGIHLGEHDISYQIARKQFSHHKIIDISCYNDLHRAELAATGDADYIAFGAMFPTDSKANTKQASPELISRAKEKYNLPIVAIGGITTDNCSSLIMAGADLLAVISSVYLADNPARVTEQFNKMIKTNEFN